MEKSLKAIPVIKKIQKKREKDFWKRRMVVGEMEERRMALFELNQGIDLVAPVVVREKQKVQEKDKEKEKVEIVEEVTEG